MKASRLWVLLALGLLLGLWYVAAFTEWLKPEPIEIIAQFRPLPKEILARRAARNAEGSGSATGKSPRPNRGAPSENSPPGTPPPEGARPVETKPGEHVQVKVETVTVGTNTAAKSKTPPPTTLNSLRLGGRNPRDIQPFVFSLDGKYHLTSVKVLETSSSNKVPPVTWWVRSKTGSPPTDNVLYGRAPDTLEPVVDGLRPDKLLPGRVYTLFVEAGRRRGQKSFSVPQEAEPLPPEDGDYHPERDNR